MFKILRAAVTPVLFPFALLGLLLVVTAEERVARGAVPGDRAGGIGDCACASACHGGIRRDPPRVGPRHRLDDRGRGRAGFSGEQGSESRADGWGWNETAWGLPHRSGRCCSRALMLAINSRGMEFENPSPFAVYHATAGWLARNVKGSGAGARYDRLVALLQSSVRVITLPTFTRPLATRRRAGSSCASRMSRAAGPTRRSSAS